MENLRDLEKKVNLDEFGLKNEPGIEYIKSEEKITGSKDNPVLRVCILKRSIDSGIVLSYIYSFKPMNRQYSQ